MEINRNEEKKIIEIWLTNQDQENPAIKTITEEIIYYWHQQEYLPVIYRSGKGDLYSNIKPLLKHNREYSAKKSIFS